MITTELKRVFKYAAMTLPDPGPQFSAEEVRNLYTNTYPELASAAIDGPEATEAGELVYTFRKAVGTKGSLAKAPVADAVRAALQAIAAHGGDEGMPSDTCARAWQTFAEKSRYARSNDSERLTAPAGVATLLGPVL